MIYALFIVIYECSDYCVLILTAIQLAAAEFMLLGATLCILHSRGSSFAREAAAAMMRPVIDVCIYVCVWVFWVEEISL